MWTQWNPYHIRLTSTYILQPVYDCCEIVRLSKDCLLSWAVLGAVRTKSCGGEEQTTEKQSLLFVFLFEHGEHSYFRAERSDLRFRSTILQSIFTCPLTFQTNMIPSILIWISGGVLSFWITFSISRRVLLMVFATFKLSDKASYPN